MTGPGAWSPRRPGPRPERIAAVVFDFDGTLTDADRHAAPFQAATRRELARRLALDPERLGLWWREAEGELRAGPPDRPACPHGLPVAPALGDPYLTANTVVRTIVERRGLAPGPGGASAVVAEVHDAAYASVRPPLREQARAVLDGVVERGRRVFVVTNSRTDSVSSRLDELGLAHRSAVEVRGDARKLVLGPPREPSPLFDALPESTAAGGLTRPVLLRRGCYFDALRLAWEAAGGSPASTLVCGDLFELDLAMPAALGCHVHLALRASTLAHERAAALAAERGGAGSLLDVLTRLDG